MMRPARAFAQPSRWVKMRVVTFSWQTSVGWGSRHGLLILAPRAVSPIGSYDASEAAAQDFSHDQKGGKRTRELFEGRDHQHASLLAAEDISTQSKGLIASASLGALQARACQRRRAHG